jgi:glycosyltransferase involved in cell wall biosynthesis
VHQPSTLPPADRSPGPAVAVSVVIPTYQRREALRRTLASLARQSTPPEAYEVIVSVDGSSDGTLGMLSELDVPYALRVAQGPRRGRARACNAGLALARGETIIVLDDDMEVVPEFVERHHRHHPPGSRSCVLGAVPVTVHEDSPLAARYIEAKFAAHLANLERPGHVFVPRDFYTGNASVRAEVLREVGGFDESFAAYGNEDVELALRLRDAGVTPHYDATAVARQEYDKPLPALARDTLAKGGTTVQLARSHPLVFAALRLSQPYDASRPWIAARAVLLALTRREKRLAGAVFAVAGALERLGLWRRPLFYRALLDYAFWSGADRALAPGAEETGELARLAAELRRGPIDLLLHR